MTFKPFKIFLVGVFVVQVITVGLVWRLPYNEQPSESTRSEENEIAFQKILKELDDVKNGIRFLKVSSQMKADLMPDTPNPVLDLNETLFPMESLQEVIREELQAYSKETPFPTEAIRKIIREELHAYLSAVPPVQAASNEEMKPKIDPRVQHEAMETANSVVHRALSRGVWTEDDNSLMAAPSQHLSQSQKEELNLKIIGAINRQELRLDRDHLPRF